MVERVAFPEQASMGGREPAPACLLLGLPLLGSRKQGRVWLGGRRATRRLAHATDHFQPDDDKARVASMVASVGLSARDDYRRRATTKLGQPASHDCSTACRTRSQAPPDELGPASNFWGPALLAACWAGPAAVGLIPSPAAVWTAGDRHAARARREESASQRRDLLLNGRRCCPSSARFALVGRRSIPLPPFTCSERKK